jgi:hypothetical protein
LSLRPSGTREVDQKQIQPACAPKRSDFSKAMRWSSHSEVNQTDKGIRSGQHEGRGKKEVNSARSNKKAGQKKGRAEALPF